MSQLRTINLINRIKFVDSTPLRYIHSTTAHRYPDLGLSTIISAANLQNINHLGRAWVWLRRRRILLLPPEPSHLCQNRAQELGNLQKKMKSLLKQHKGGVSQTIYITGQPGYGKSQLAREFGYKYYRSKFIFRKAFVGTLNASSHSSLFHSYKDIAKKLGCISPEFQTKPST